MDITKWDETWGTIDWEKDSEDEIKQKITDFFHAGVDFNMLEDGPYTSHGCYVDAEGSPLHYAAMYSSEKVIELLINGGANLFFTDNMGLTPLHWVAKNGKTKNVKYLIEHGPRNYVNKKEYKDDTPLHYAAGQGHPEMVKALIEAGADVCAKNEDNETPLHYAARQGNLVSVKLLIENGADLNAKDKEGRTPLHLAILGNSPKAAQELIRRGVDPTILTKNDEAALRMAIYYERLEIIEMLLAHNSNLLNQKDYQGWTPLHHAALKGSVGAINVLLDANPNIINEQNDIGHSALFLAVHRNQPEAVRALIERGAKVNIKFGSYKLFDYASDKEIKKMLFMAKQIRIAYLLKKKTINSSQVLMDGVSQTLKAISVAKKRKTR